MKCYPVVLADGVGGVGVGGGCKGMGTRMRNGRIESVLQHLMWMLVRQTWLEAPGTRIWDSM